MSFEGTAIKPGRPPQSLKAYGERGPSAPDTSFTNRGFRDHPDLSPTLRNRDGIDVRPSHEPERRRSMTVIVADSNRSVAELLAANLAHLAWVDGTRVCDTAGEALQWISGAAAPLVVSEIAFRDQTGVYLAQEVRRMCPMARIAIWADRLSDLVLERLVQIPVQGCFLKQDSLTSLHTGLDMIAQGKTYFTPLVQQRFIDGVVRPGGVRGSAVLKNFSPRHLNVLLRLAEGDSVKVIANALGVSVKTIDCLKYRMMKQLQLHDRVELARWAIGEGLITV